MLDLTTYSQHGMESTKFPAAHSIGITSCLYSPISLLLPQNHIANDTWEKVRGTGWQYGNLGESHNNWASYHDWKPLHTLSAPPTYLIVSKEIMWQLEGYPRGKREDDCLDCGIRRMWLTTDIAIAALKDHEKCMGQNIMVCKSCEAHDLKGLSLHTWEGRYEVWCVQSGRIILKVESTFHLSSVGCCMCLGLLFYSTTSPLPCGVRHPLGQLFIWVWLGLLVLTVPSQTA